MERIAGALGTIGVFAALVFPAKTLAADSAREPAALPRLAAPDLLWRVESIELEPSVAALAFSPDGRYLAVSSPSVVRVLDTADGRVVEQSRAEAPQRLSYSLAIASTGRVSIGRPGSRQVHEVGDDLPIVVFPCDSPGCTPVSIAFSPDDTVLAYQEIDPRPAAPTTLGSVVIVDLVFGVTTRMSASRGLAETVFAAPPPRADEDVASDGEIDAATFELWRTDDQRLPRSLRGRGWTVGAVNGDSAERESGTVAVYGSGSTLVMREFAGDRLVWATPLVRPALAPPDSGASLSRAAHVELSPDGRFVLVYEIPMTTDREAAAAGAVVVRRGLDGEIVATYDIHGVADLAIAPDGGSFAYTTATALPETALVRVPEVR